jgi:hypothetical protein
MNRSTKGIVVGLVLGGLAVALISAGAALRAGGIVAAARALAAFEQLELADEAAQAGAYRARNDGKLVLASGTPVILAAPQTGDGKVVAAGALALATEVLRYEERTTGSGNDKRTTRQWESTGGAETRYAQLRLGDYAVDPALLDGLTAAQPLVLDQATLARLDPKLVVAPNEVYYGSGTPGAPVLNDLRIRYSVAPLGEISVLALQRGHALERELRFATTLGVPLQFDLGISRPGRRGSAEMLALQRERIGSGTGLARFLGAAAVVLGGFLLLFAVGAWTQRGTVVHPLQLAPVLAWLFVATPLAWLEQALAALIAWPALLQAACVAAALALAVALVALYGLAARAARRASRRRY